MTSIYFIGMGLTAALSVTMFLKTRKLKLKLKDQQKVYSYQQQELTSSIVKSTETFQLLNEINAEMVQILKHVDSRYKLDLKKVQRKIQRQLKLEEDNPDQYIRTYPELIEKLKKIAPELTFNELKLCVLIRSNLSAKEMARITNTTPQTMYEFRYRIRKKLGLSKDEDLNLYLFKL